MKILILFFAAFLAASEASPLHCSSEQPLSSGNGVDNIMEVTKVQYCVIDDCTILRIDDGQKLDIIYTTESIIVATPKGNLTSVAIAKNQSKLFCSTFHPTTSAIPTGRFNILIILASLIVLAGGCNLTIHLLFKKFHNPFEKLIPLYSFSIASQFTVFFFLLLLSHTVAMNSQPTCHIMIILFMILSISAETFAMCILVHLAYLVYRSYKMLRISKKKSKCLFRRYMTFALCTLVLSFGSAVTFDLLTDSGKYTLLSNGYCNYYNENFSYKTLVVMIIVVGLYKTSEIITFGVYLFYFYKLKIECLTNDNSSINRRLSARLIKVAVVMGATIGVPNFIYLFDTSQVEVIGMAFLLIQQCVIVASFQKIIKLCKKHLPPWKT